MRDLLVFVVLLAPDFMFVFYYYIMITFYFIILCLLFCIIYKLIFILFYYYFIIMFYFYYSILLPWFYSRKSCCVQYCAKLCDAISDAPNCNISQNCFQEISSCGLIRPPSCQRDSSGACPVPFTDPFNAPSLPQALHPSLEIFFQKMATLHPPNIWPFTPNIWMGQLACNSYVWRALLLGAEGIKLN